MKAHRYQVLHRRAEGMTLLEVVLALAVFSIAVLALVGTLNKIAETAVESQVILEVEQSLESLIDEYGKMPQMRNLEEDIKPGADGVAYRVKVEQVKDLKNKEGQFLQDMFRIQAFARWNDGGTVIELEADSLRYAGAFLPRQ
jgi:prepilin-type N-terminal cleavage/methylation domain-containing protein